MKKLDGVSIYGNEKKGELFFDKILNKKPLFLLTIGVTETAKILGISAAGKHPEFTDYTPPADAELLLLGKCKCINGVPVTPEGIPTPALISMSALNTADIPVLVVNSGLKIKPNVPFLDLGGKPGRDIRSGNSVDEVEKVIDNAKILGKNLAKTVDYLIIGESIPGGTTTTLGVLSAMGLKAEGKVSSSLPYNPHDLKNKAVKAGLDSAKITYGSLADKPFESISLLGDPMMAAFTGLVLGAANTVPVLMAGGTQMTAILALVNALNPDLLDKIAIGTTNWVIRDESSDLLGIIDQIGEVPVLTADLSFSNSVHEGLKAYEQGIVKEGVGAGGSCIGALAKFGGKIKPLDLVNKIEQNYSLLMNLRDK